MGVDSFSLRSGADWLSEAEVTLGIFDAGTDQGLTFSAPNWESRPQENVTRITSQNPSHPASSFFYPELEALPNIATLTIKRIMTSCECNDVIMIDANQNNSGWVHGYNFSMLIFASVIFFVIVFPNQQRDFYVHIHGTATNITCNTLDGTEAVFQWFQHGREIAENSEAFRVISRRESSILEVRLSEHESTAPTPTLTCDVNVYDQFSWMQVQVRQENIESVLSEYVCRVLSGDRVEELTQTLHLASMSLKNTRVK